VPRQTCGAIVASAGSSRRKLLDRMIAAQAPVHRATLIPSTRTTSQRPWSLVLGLAIGVAQPLPRCATRRVKQPRGSLP